MIDYMDMHRALTQSIIDANLGVPIAHENTVLNPSKLNAYVEVDTLTEERDSMTKDGYGEVYGVYQATVNVRQGKSVSQALNLVTKITNHYRDSLTLDSNDTQVIITNAYREAGERDNGWYSIPVTINFRARPKV